MPIISVRITNEEKDFLDTMAKFKGTTVSELLRKNTFDKLEDEYDATIVEEAYQAYKKNPITHTHEEMMREFGLKE